MGFLNRVFGRRDNVEQETRATGLPPDTSSVTSSTSTQQSLHIPTVLSDEVPQQAGSVVQPHQDTAVMYNPYAGLQNISPRGPHTFRVNREPEFVFQEEAAVRRRGFATNIGFYTGTGYLGGALAGGSLGLARTLMLPATSSPLPQSRRLLINRILNSSGHSGRTAGNTLGCLGLLFALSESWSVWVLDERAPNAPFWLPTVLAGACAGGVYRAPRGPKAAAITATVGAMAGAGLCSLRLFLPGL